MRCPAVKEQEAHADFTTAAETGWVLKGVIKLIKGQ